MATFSKASFSHALYAAARPSYPAALYETILSYHQGSNSLCIDLGSGHGLISRYFAPYFKNVIGVDPSPGMVSTAVGLSTGYSNVTFRQSTSESMPFVGDHTVDLVAAGQAAHWFDQSQLFPELKRVMRPGGTLAFWGYKDPALVEYPRATALLNQYTYGTGERYLGDYWSQPGRSIVRDQLRSIHPPESEWSDTTRIEYEPGTAGPGTGQGTMFINKRMKLGEIEEYIRTWSTFHAWAEAHPKAKRKRDGGAGDVVDELLEKILNAEDELQKPGTDWAEKEVEVEWGSALLLARKK